MARHAPVAPIGQYQPLHVTATGTAVAVGAAVDTTSGTTISAGSQTVTPVSMTGIVLGKYLTFSGGVGAAEVAQVTAVTPTTFTATFANGHSGAYHITSLSGTFLGTVVINKVGTTDTITLYNGSPNAPITSIIAIITPAAGASYAFNCACDKGLYYTVAGTPGDYTITYIDYPLGA